MSPWPWNQLVMSSATLSGNCQLLRALQQPTDSSAEVPLWRQVIARIGSHASGCSLCIKSEIYAPSNNTWYWEKVEVGVTQFTIFPIIYWGHWYFPPLQIWPLQMWRSYDLDRVNDPGQQEELSKLLHNHNYITDKSETQVICLSDSWYFLDQL